MNGGSAGSGAGNDRPGRRISVLVGTDHHPFSRIIDWADAWARQNPDDEVTVQYGHSGAPATARGHAFLAPAQLAELMASSDVVITHGGPATISGARSAGHLPLVLARDPRLGEHVDDHQQRFSRWSDRHSLVVCTESVPELDARVAALVTDDVGTRLEHAPGAGQTEAAVGRLVGLLAKHRSGENRSSDGAPTVLYAAAPHASGRGALIRALSHLDGVVVLGDVGRLWQSGIAEGRPCGCGVAFSACEFWQEIGKAAFGGWDQVDLDRFDSLRRGAESGLSRLRGTLPGQPLALRRDQASFSSHYQAIYRAARELSGADVVVDLRTEAFPALALGANREIDLRVLWLDPVRPAPITPSALMQSILRRRGIPSARLSERDLTTNALYALEESWNHLELPAFPHRNWSPEPRSSHLLP